MAIDTCIECKEIKKGHKYKGGDFYCYHHYHQMWRYGEIRHYNGKRKLNEFADKGSFYEMYFNDGSKGKISKSDYERVSAHYWGINSQGYVHSRISGSLVRLHIFLLDYPDNTVDHINRDKLDNRKENLRACEFHENGRNLTLKKNNSSGVAGVGQIKATGKWRARIMIYGKEINLGFYEEFDQAVAARREGEKKYFKEFAPTDSGTANSHGLR